MTIENPKTLESILRARIENAQRNAERYVDEILKIKHKITMAELDVKIAELALEALKSKA